MAKSIELKLNDELSKTLDTYLKATGVTASNVIRQAFQEYKENHEVKFVDFSYKSSGRKRALSVYDDEQLLKRMDEDRIKTGWSGAYTIEYALVNYLDKVKAMSKEEKDSRLSNVYKNHSTTKGGVDQNVYNSLKKWCKENDESMLRMTSISVLLYLEDKGE